MYSEEQRLRALEIYEECSHRVTKTIRRLEYPSRQALYRWNDDDRAATHQTNGDPASIIPLRPREMPCSCWKAALLRKRSQTAGGLLMLPSFTIGRVNRRERSGNVQFLAHFNSSIVQIPEDMARAFGMIRLSRFDQPGGKTMFYPIVTFDEKPCAASSRSSSEEQPKTP